MLKDFMDEKRLVNSLKEPIWLVVQINLSAFFLIHAITNLTAHLHTDEMLFAARVHSVNFTDMLQPLMNVTPEIAHPNQTIAKITSWISTRLFSVNEIALRTPSILFTLCFLIALFFYCRSYMAKVSACILYLHLLMNQSLVWYLHSSKGYASGILFSFLSYYFAQSLLRHGLTKGRVVLFLLSYLLACMSTTFAAIYCVLISLALVFTVVRRQSNKRDRAFSLSVATALLPVALWYIFNHWLYLRKINDLHSDQLGKLSVSLLQAFGLTDYGLVFFLLLVGVAGVSWWLHEKRPEEEFGFYTQIGVILFFSTTILVLRPGVFYSRYFVVFVIPLIIWTLEGIAKIRILSLRDSFRIAAFYIVAIVPYLTSYQLKHYYQNLGIGVSITPFVQSIRYHLRESQYNCFEVDSQNELFNLVMKRVYLKDDSECINNYLLVYKPTRNLGPSWTRVLSYHHLHLYLNQSNSG